jgi:hypothetical protein
MFILFYKGNTTFNHNEHIIVNNKVYNYKNLKKCNDHLTVTYFAESFKTNDFVP